MRIDVVMRESQTDDVWKTSYGFEIFFWQFWANHRSFIMIGMIEMSDFHLDVWLNQRFNGRRMENRRIHERQFNGFLVVEGRDCL